MAKETSTHFIKLYARGQITIPVEFRKRLGINEETILKLELKGPKIEITPLRVLDKEQPLREYGFDEVDAFLVEDEIDEETAAKVRRLLAG